MSLSFVSSAVLSSTDGVSHNEETEVTSKELEAVRKNAMGGSSKSLFDQLRSNQDELEEEKAQAERARMRGTLALDEDDVAHLNALMRSKAQSELQRKVEMDQEMALFRAAREERRSGHVVIDDDDDDDHGDGDNHDNNNKKANERNSDKFKPALPSFIPKIVGKRRRKELVVSDSATETNKKQKPTVGPPQAATAGGTLEDLLGAYGSSSSSDDDDDA